MIGTVGLLVRDQRILVSNTYFIENLRENRHEPNVTYLFYRRFQHKIQFSISIFIIVEKLSVNLLEGTVSLKV